MRAASTEVVHLEDLRVVLGRRNVLVIDRFHVARGDIVAILGPNGSGKSTLLRTCALLLQPASGLVRLFDEAPATRSRQVALRRRTASVFSEPTLLDMSVRANVETALRLHGVAAAERPRRADAWLDRLGIGPRALVRPHTLSAGEAQRVALARAFAVEPELMLLDEPFASVDAETRGRLVGELRDLLRAQHTTAIFATHDRGEAQLVADRAVVLIDGRCEQEGPVTDVLQHPASMEVAAFLGYSVVSGTGLARAVPGVQPVAAFACIPPDAVSVAAPGSLTAVSARVLAVRGALGHAQLVCDLGAPVAVDVPISFAVKEFPAGERVIELDVAVERIRWFEG